jgi:hypothetical protein
MLVLSASFKFRPAVGIATYSSKPANVRDQTARLARLLPPLQKP